VHAATAGKVRYLDGWTNGFMAVVAAPLLLWGAASTFQLTNACFHNPWISWIPAASTSGVILVTSRLRERTGLDAHIKRLASYLIAVAMTIEISVSGIQHVLPSTLNPPALVLFFMGCVPTGMGGFTYKLWRMAAAAEREANAAAEQARIEASEQAQAAIVAAQAQAEAERARLAAEREKVALWEDAQARQRSANLAAQREAAQLAAQQTEAQLRLAEAQARVANAVNAAPAPAPKTTKANPKKPLHAVDTDALGRVAKPSPKRDAALRYLIEQAKAGRLDEVTAAEVDKHIEANSYARRYLAEWKRDVLAHLREVA
jgi:Na+-transporting methylmalonyl-CoA/oxaloacetate decarboxylase gamma subunit